MLTAIELIEIFQVLLYDTNAVGLSRLTVKGALPSLAMDKVVPFRAKCLEVLIDPIDYGSLVRWNAAEFDPIP